MTNALPEIFLRRPFAHRGLHDVDNGRPENSLSAAEAAIAGNYGIELDVQMTADTKAVVFHDYQLERLTGVRGATRRKTQSELGKVKLSGGDECIPSLSQFLELVQGRVPLLLEIKDQDGALGDDVGPLETAVAAALNGYEGDVAVMSFNPHSVSAMRKLAPNRPRGLVTDAFTVDQWPVPEPVLERLREIPDFTNSGSAFISHQASDLDRRRVAELKKSGVPILCWTVRSHEEECEARKVADNVTFEGYLA